MNKIKVRYIGEDAAEIRNGEIYEAEELLGKNYHIFPYNFDSYDDYYQYIDELILRYSGKPNVAEKLQQVRDTVKKMNQKEQWSILRYIGQTDDQVFGLTNGKNYYWPTQADDPVYCGVIDNEEFTAYLYPTEPSLWEILEDPTGMAYRTVFEKGKGYVSQKNYDGFMKAIEEQMAE